MVSDTRGTLRDRGATISDTRGTLRHKGRVVSSYDPRVSFYQGFHTRSNVFPTLSHCYLSQFGNTNDR